MLLSRSVGAYMETIQRYRGLNQTELSKFAGLPHSTLSNLLRGIENLGLDTVERIGANLNINPVLLLGYPQGERELEMLWKLPGVLKTLASLPADKHPCLAVLLGEFQKHWHKRSF